MTDQAWNLQPGDHMTRSERTRRFGGNPQAGIAPSARTPNVFLYSDPDTAGTYGYDHDGWVDGIWLYTGDGQVGDQTWSPGNTAIRDHRREGRALRLFVADGVVPGTTNEKSHVYVGEFEVSRTAAYEVRRAPDKNGDERDVFVFRLVPVGAALPQDRVEAPPSCRLVPPEQHHAELHERRGAAPGEARRVEAALVLAYIDHLTSLGLATATYELDVPGAAGTLRTDLFVPDTGELIEAKASTSRGDVRTALGQLYDYRRHISPPPRSLAVLLPGRPTADLVDLLHRAGINVVHRDEGGSFRRLDV